MNKTLLLVLTGTLALSVEGCSYMSDFAKKRQEIEDPPTISVKAKASEAGAKSSQSEELAIESDKEDAVNRSQNVTGLIPSTNPEVRARSSKRGRQDPFAIISVEPRVEIKQDPQAANKPRRNPTRTNPRPRPQTRSTSSNTRVRKPPEIKTTPTIDNTPSAEIAENVLITGFVELGDRIKLILQAPEEGSSRYVEVGQYVSNGKVLVKRIEPGFPTPLVVLEESGIEVTKVIGVVEETPEEEKKANSLLPPAPPVSDPNPLSLLSEKEVK